MSTIDDTRLQLPDVTAILDEIEAIQSERASIARQISELEDRRFTLNSKMTFYDSDREDQLSVVARYNKAVRTAAANLLNESGLGWCMKGRHFCNPSELFCARMHCSYETHGTKYGYDTNTHEVVVTVCDAHQSGGFTYDSYGRGTICRVFAVKNAQLLQNSLKRYLLVCGFVEHELCKLFIDAGIPVDIYLNRDSEYCFRKDPYSSCGIAEKRVLS